MNKAQTDKVLAQIGPQPARLIITPFSAVDISRFPCLYIMTERDRALTPKKQRKTLSRFPDCQVKSINTGHFGMISRPDALVPLLVGS